MLTDDGKNLYVSWGDYHLLIEKLGDRLGDAAEGLRLGDGRQEKTDVGPLIGLTESQWDAVVDLVGHGAEFPTPPVSVTLPAGWERLMLLDGVQLVDTPSFTDKDVGTFTAPESGTYRFAVFNERDPRLDLLQPRSCRRPEGP